MRIETRTNCGYCHGPYDGGSPPASRAGTETRAGCTSPAVLIMPE